jgi:hypothetical protein
MDAVFQNGESGFKKQQVLWVFRSLAPHVIGNFYR